MEYELWDLEELVNQRKQIQEKLTLIKVKLGKFVKQRECHKRSSIVTPAWNVSQDMSKTLRKVNWSVCGTFMALVYSNSSCHLYSRQEGKWRYIRLYDIEGHVLQYVDPRGRLILQRERDIFVCQGEGMKPTFLCTMQGEHAFFCLNYLIDAMRIVDLETDRVINDCHSLMAGLRSACSADGGGLILQDGSSIMFWDPRRDTMSPIRFKFDKDLSPCIKGRLLSEEYAWLLTYNSDVDALRLETWIIGSDRTIRSGGSVDQVQLYCLAGDILVIGTVGKRSIDLLTLPSLALIRSIELPLDLDALSAPMQNSSFLVVHLATSGWKFIILREH